MNNTKPEKCIITIAVGMLIVCMLAAPAMGSCSFSPASPYMSLNVNEQQGIKMIGISKYFASPFVTFSADLELTDWIPGEKAITAACVDGNRVNSYTTMTDPPPGTYRLLVGADVTGRYGIRGIEFQVCFLPPGGGELVCSNVDHVTASLPNVSSEYHDYNALEFIDSDIEMTVNPEQKEFWKNQSSEIENLLADTVEKANELDEQGRHAEAADWAQYISMLKDMLDAAKMFAGEAGDYGGGAKAIQEVGGPVSLVLGVLQAAAMVEATGGDFNDFVKRYTHGFATDLVNPLPFNEKLAKMGWEQQQKDYYFSILGNLDNRKEIPSIGYLAGGIYHPVWSGYRIDKYDDPYTGATVIHKYQVSYTPQNLPPNYHRKWKVGPFETIGGTVDHFMLNVKEIEMGPGDYFTVYDSTGTNIIRQIGSGEHYDKGLKITIDDEYGYIEITTDGSGSDSKGYKIDSEAPIYARCHQARYYSGSSAIIANLKKFGTENVPINFDWGPATPYPEVPAGSFTGQWLGELNISSNGTYTFYLAGENGGAVMWLFTKDELGDEVDNEFQTCLSCSGPGFEEYSYTLNLTEGWYPFALQYVHFDDDDTRDASFRWSWSGPGIAKQVVPESSMRTKFITMSDVALLYAEKEVLLPGAVSTMGVVAGNQYIVNVTVRNEGTSASNATTLTLYDDGAAVESMSLPAIFPGEEAVVGFNWTPSSAGIINLTTNISSNEVFKDVPGEIDVLGAGLPDLVITYDIGFMPGFKSNYTVINVNVVNNGTGSADNFWIKVYYGWSTLICNQLMSVGPKSSKRFTCMYNFGYGGPYPIRVVLDADGDVAESDEANNEWTGQLNVIEVMLLDTHHYGNTSTYNGMYSDWSDVEMFLVTKLVPEGTTPLVALKSEADVLVCDKFIDDEVFVPYPVVCGIDGLIGEGLYNYNPFTWNFYFNGRLMPMEAVNQIRLRDGETMHWDFQRKIYSEYDSFTPPCTSQSYAGYLYPEPFTHGIPMNLTEGDGYSRTVWDTVIVYPNGSSDFQSLAGDIRDTLVAGGVPAGQISINDDVSITSDQRSNCNLILIGNHIANSLIAAVNTVHEDTGMTVYFNYTSCEIVEDDDDPVTPPKTYDHGAVVVAFDNPWNNGVYVDRPGSVIFMASGLG